MDVHLESTYPADPGRLYAVLTDPAFLRTAAEATGALQTQADATAGESGGDTVLRRVLPANVPDFARAFVGETLDISERVHWNAAGPGGARTGTFTIDIAGAPVRMTGTTELVPDGTGCRHVVAGEIRAGIPFVGRRIEQAAADAIEAAFTQQTRVAREWLDGGVTPARDPG